MVRKRLILSLLINNDCFVNSCNFKLQNIINLETIMEHLNFEAIDELVILNVSRGEKDINLFCEQIKEIAKNCFVPISAGGGVKSIEDFNKLLRCGADKVIINTAAIENPDLIVKGKNFFGSQCVVVSIDAKKLSEDKYTVYSHNGQIDTKKDVFEYIKFVEDLGAGEIFLTSIDNDGLSKGYDINLLKKAVNITSIPVIASGGVGEFEHLVQAIKEADVSAVSLANLFHFIGHSLVKAKKYLISKGLDVPEPLWNF